MTELFFTIPTYRHRDVHRCLEEYLKNFEQFYHNIPCIIFDDTPKEKSHITIQHLQQIALKHPTADIRYVGPDQKGAFLDQLQTTYNNPLINEMLRPSYGGNRNWILLTTIGHHFISVDDDMHPYGTYDIRPCSQTSSERNCVLEGTYQKSLNKFPQQTHDLITAYSSMLGKKVSDYKKENPNIFTGAQLVDSNNDLLTNISTGELKDNSVTIEPGKLNPNATIKIVQTHLSGDADIDSVDLVREFLKTGSQEAFLGVIPLKYAIHHLEPCIIAQDYKLTGAVLGLDNTEGFIGFLPTRLRFEDYIFRQYSKKEDIHVGYCDAAQTHRRNMANRNNIVDDYVIESIATIIKKKIINGVRSIGELEIRLLKDPSYNIQELYDIWHNLCDFSQSVNISNSFGEKFFDAAKTQAISFDDAGPFVAKQAARINEEYTRIRQAIKLWPILVEYATTHKVPQLQIRP